MSSLPHCSFPAHWLVIFLFLIKGINYSFHFALNRGKKLLELKHRSHHDIVLASIIYLFTCFVKVKFRVFAGRLR